MIIRLHSLTKFCVGIYSLRMHDLKEYHDWNMHPSPSDDEGLNWLKIQSENLYFGFGSIDQLRNWFYDSDFFIENQDRFTVSEVDCKDFKIGNSQAVFDIRSVKEIFSFSPVAVLDWDNRGDYFISSSRN